MEFDLKIFRTQQEAQERYDICKTCDSFRSITCTCKECKCFMKAKVKVRLMSCPLGKWS